MSYQYFMNGIGSTIEQLLERELRRFVADSTQAADIRASALMMLLKPAARLPDLESMAQGASLRNEYLALRESLRQVIENSGGLWKLRPSNAEACQANIRNGIRKNVKIWLIHGGASSFWERVGNFLVRDLHLQYVEFNDPNASRVDIQRRIEQMASSAQIGVAVMTAEDRTNDGKLRARQNVIHEIGIAQGRFGFDGVVILRQQGIEDFSNMGGLVYVSFDESAPVPAFADLKNHLESRLGLVDS